MLKELFPHADWGKLWEATIETLYMTSISVGISFILGIILGLLLFLTAKGGFYENAYIYKFAAAVVNVFRSIPFIILIILIIPFTIFLLNTMIGAKAAIPALVIGSAPFYARLVEIGLREVDKGVIEAAQSMGATKLQIIYKVLLPESMPALISGITVTSIALVSYTAMAGVIGGGGLGSLAFLEGYQRNHGDITFLATVSILIIVFFIQVIGDTATRVIDKR
ncbi:MAG TPA: methionine ABC transporter permease [Bacillales bacterium]|nr:methionine ABC transporter permease [Bacillales bacterium]